MRSHQWPASASPAKARHLAVSRSIVPLPSIVRNPLIFRPNYWPIALQGAFRSEGIVATGVVSSVPRSGGGWPWHAETNVDIPLGVWWKLGVRGEGGLFNSPPPKNPPPPWSVWPPFEGVSSNPSLDGAPCWPTARLAGGLFCLCVHLFYPGLWSVRCGPLTSASVVILRLCHYEPYAMY